MMPVNTGIVRYLKNLGKIALNNESLCKYWIQRIFLPVYRRIGGLELMAM